MKISEAIREGSKVSRPIEGGILRKDSLGNVYSCALGAAFIGNGGSTDTEPGDVYHALEEMWPDIYLAQLTDEFKDREVSLATFIWQKNDIEHWTRERIAAAVEEKGY